jgi:glycosyltransferase involved in cell wall biosynthesis
MAFAELVVSGENGILVESSSEIVQAIQYYLSNPEIATRHAENGRAIAQRHSWDSIASEIEAILLSATRSNTDALPGPVVQFSTSH